MNVLLFVEDVFNMYMHIHENLKAIFSRTSWLLFPAPVVPYRRRGIYIIWEVQKLPKDSYVATYVLWWEVNYYSDDAAEALASQAPDG
jgi:hypothetical protein